MEIKDMFSIATVVKEQSGRFDFFHIDVYFATSRRQGAGSRKWSYNGQNSNMASTIFIVITTKEQSYRFFYYFRRKMSHHVHRKDQEITVLIRKSEESEPSNFMKI